MSAIYTELLEVVKEKGSAKFNFDVEIGDLLLIDDDFYLVGDINEQFGTCDDCTLLTNIKTDDTLYRVRGFGSKVHEMIKEAKEAVIEE